MAHAICSKAAFANPATGSHHGQPDRRHHGPHCGRIDTTARSATSLPCRTISPPELRPPSSRNCMTREQRRAAVIQRPMLAAYDLVQRGNWYHNKFTAIGRGRGSATVLGGDRCRSELCTSLREHGLQRNLGCPDGMVGRRRKRRWRPRLNLRARRSRSTTSTRGGTLPWRKPCFGCAGMMTRSRRRDGDCAQSEPGAGPSVLGYALNCVGEFEEALRRSRIRCACGRTMKRWYAAFRPFRSPITSSAHTMRLMRSRSASSA